MLGVCVSYIIWRSAIMVKYIKKPNKRIVHMERSVGLSMVED